MVITVVQKRNRFSRFFDDKTPIPHYKIRVQRKSNPNNWKYSRPLSLKDTWRGLMQNKYPLYGIIF